MQHLWLDVPYKGGNAKQDAEDVNSVISIANHLTGSAAVDAPLFFALDGA